MLKAVKDEELLEPIKDPFEFEEVIHGTYFNCLEPIMKTGLNKMTRNHMRNKQNIKRLDFALGKPGKKGVISGMRNSCEVVIEINLVKAIYNKIPFFISTNKVILSPGILNGSLPPEFFRTVQDYKKFQYIH